MAMLDRTVEDSPRSTNLAELCGSLWKGRVVATLDDDARICRLKCGLDELVQVCQWLSRDLGFAFATLIVEGDPDAGWSLVYVFYKDADSPWVYVLLQLDAHARLGEFILHEDWPESVNPMRRSFDARQRFESRELDPKWQPPTIVTAPGAFAMPICPVFSA